MPMTELDKKCLYVDSACERWYFHEPPAIDCPVELVQFDFGALGLEILISTIFLKGKSDVMRIGSSLILRARTWPNVRACRRSRKSEAARPMSKTSLFHAHPSQS